VCKHGQHLDSAEQPGRSAEPGEMNSRAGAGAGEKRYTTPPAPLEARKKFKITGF
jgi:hypothetical protein